MSPPPDEIDRLDDLEKRNPYEHLRLLREQEHIKTIGDEIVGKQCIFFYNKNWVFDYSLADSDARWDVTQQVYFRNVRKHKSLAFVLPYIVIQLVLPQSSSYLRAIVTYGEDISKMVGSMGHFIKQEDGIKAWIEQPVFSWQPSDIYDLSKRLLNAEYDFKGIEFYRYHEPFHVKLNGSWESILLEK